MAACGVSLLLFRKKAGMDFWRRQQNVSLRGLSVAFREEGRNGFLAEAAKWPPSGSHCCSYGPLPVKWVGLLEVFAQIEYYGMGFAHF